MAQSILSEQPPTSDDEAAGAQEQIESTISGIPSSESARVLVSQPTTPGQVLLGTLGDGRLRVMAPIRVRFEREGEHVIAEAVEFDEFGFGQNPSTALADLQHAVVELYWTLDQERDRLGPDLQRLWGLLQEKLERRP